MNIYDGRGGASSPSSAGRRRSGASSAFKAVDRFVSGARNAYLILMNSPSTINRKENNLQSPHFVSFEASPRPDVFSPFFVRASRSALQRFCSAWALCSPQCQRSIAARRPRGISPRPRRSRASESLSVAPSMQRAGAQINGTVYYLASRTTIAAVAVAMTPNRHSFHFMDFRSYFPHLNGIETRPATTKRRQ